MKHTLSRRQALAAMGAMAVAPMGFAAQEKKPKAGMALQLYTMREPAKKDLPGMLKRVREIGWEYVQWSGMPSLSAEEIRAELDKAGLKAVTAHTSVESFEKDFEGSVKFWKTVGVSALGPGGMMGDCRKDLEGWLAGAKRFDAVGAKLHEVGIKLSYHNHAMEFEKFPGDDRCKLDILMESTQPENLFAELDLAWVHVGGADPVAYIKKYKGRCPMVHAKEVADPNKSKQKFAPLGEGILDWDAIFAAGQEAGIEWYIYEQDNGDGDPFDWAKISYDFLKKNLA